MGSFEKLKPGGIYIIEDVTPQDRDVISPFVHCIAYVSKSIVFEELDHPLNKIDNRLVMIQKA
jgi:hypothetical protein